MPFARFWRDYSHSALIAGLIAVLVPFAGPIAVVYQAADAAGLSNAQLNSWIWAIALGSGLAGIYLSWKSKMPVVIAWSTPGAALLVTGLTQYSYPEAVGAYILGAALTLIFGLTGLFQAVISRVPQAIATAMLAGVLFQFGVAVFTQLQHAPALVLPIIAAYLLGKRCCPRYAIPVALLAGCLAVALLGLHGEGSVTFALVTPVFTAPRFTLASAVGLALPLFLVTMTSQNVPGLTVLLADGYTPDVRPILTVTGLFSLLLAPFGAHSINLAAITAAICTGPEAHPDKGRRYIAGICNGFFYVLVGLFGGAVVSAFALLPAPLTASIAGLALFASISNSMTIAMSLDREREAALITFLITASGFSVFNIASAFWGLAGGLIALAALNAGRRA